MNRVALEEINSIVILILQIHMREKEDEKKGLRLKGLPKKEFNRRQNYKNKRKVSRIVSKKRKKRLISKTR